MAERSVQQKLRFAGRARRDLGTSGTEEPAGLSSGIGAQDGRSGEERSARGPPSPGHGAGRGTFEVGGDAFVGLSRRFREVPGAPVRILAGVGRYREGLVYPPALDRGGAVVDGRADQRVPEPDDGSDDDQVFGLGRSGGPGPGGRSRPPPGLGRGGGGRLPPKTGGGARPATTGPGRRSGRRPPS